MGERVPNPRRGASMVEVIMAVSLLAIVIAKLTMVMSTDKGSTDRQSDALVVEEQARQVLDRITYAIMGADRTTLIPDPESPIFSNRLRYRASLGVEEGEVIWGAPEEITLSDELQTKLLWTQNPGEEEARSLAWSKIVRPYLEGELPNGVDDNGNGLIDEKGLTFTLQGDTVTILLTLERVMSDGKTYTQSVKAVANCRN